VSVGVALGLHHPDKSAPFMMPDQAVPARSFYFCVERMMRFTTETGTPKVRAMVGAFRPASNDARMRFAFPSGISAISVRSIRDGILPALGAGRSSSVPPVEVPRFRLAISASTAACSR
jgi:hypothetical protein